jgi:hypothetical protein
LIIQDKENKKKESRERMYVDLISQVAHHLMKLVKFLKEKSDYAQDPVIIEKTSRHL